MGEKYSQISLWRIVCDIHIERKLEKENDGEWGLRVVYQWKFEQRNIRILSLLDTIVRCVGPS